MVFSLVFRENGTIEYPPAILRSRPQATLEIVPDGSKDKSSAHLCRFPLNLPYQCIGVLSEVNSTVIFNFPFISVHFRLLEFSVLGRLRRIWTDGKISFFAHLF